MWLLAAAFLVAASDGEAQPWRAGQGQGWAEALVDAPDGNRLVVTCPYAAGAGAAPAVFVTLDGERPYAPRDADNRFTISSGGRSILLRSRWIDTLDHPAPLVLSWAARSPADAATYHRLKRLLAGAEQPITVKLVGSTMTATFTARGARQAFTLQLRYCKSGGRGAR